MVEIIRNNNGDWKLKIMKNGVLEIQDDKKSITSVNRIKTREDMTDEEIKQMEEIEMKISNQLDEELKKYQKVRDKR